MEKIVFYFFLCAIIGACSATNPLARIIAGDTVDIKDYPYQVSLRYKDGDNPPFHFCGGSIIDKNYILTAAHCLVHSDYRGGKVYASVENLKIYTVTSKLDDQGSVFDVASFKSHPDLERRTATNDIALIKLSKPIQFTNRQKPIKLASQPIRTGMMGTVTGWGQTEISGNRIPSKILLKTTATLIDHVICQKMTNRSVIETQICGYNKNKIQQRHVILYSRTCTGDSGGPVVAGKKLVGIVSRRFVERCGTRNPDVYTDVYDYLDFIKEGLEN